MQHGFCAKRICAFEGLLFQGDTFSKRCTSNHLRQCRNAIAERVNGIIKEEYLNHYQTDNLPEANKQLKKAISLYNKDRPHMSIGNLTPSKLHNNQKINHQRLWKNYFKKPATFENKNENHPVNLLQDLSINL